LFGADFADLEAVVRQKDRQQTIRAVLFSGRKPRQLYVGGVKQKTAAALSGNLTTVLFCPEDLMLLKAGASGRRRLLDLALCQLRPRYAAALAEWKLGAARGLNSCMYVTVGTGVGAGLVVEGRLVHGLLHPELGHMLLRPESGDPAPKGFCPFHEGCIEGLASGPAMEKRWGRKAYELPPDHEAWDLEADYLAQMCMNALCAFSPEKIILGGGVMQQKHLFPRIREKTKVLLNGYIRHPRILNGMEDLITEPGLGTRSGALGALLLAREALEKHG